MDHQPVLVGVDRRDPGMMPLEMQAAVMIPCRSCKGVVLEAAVGVSVCADRARRVTAPSKDDGTP
jgi:hypothetical protein